jgi:hypothetical protein
VSRPFADGRGSRCWSAAAASGHVGCSKPPRRVPARSRAEFIAKIGIVVEEVDECVFWLEVLEEASIVPRGRVKDLSSEANQLLAIFSASQRTAKLHGRLVGTCSMSQSPDDPMAK